MSYDKILSRFTDGFPVLGVYLYDSGRILILSQNDQRGTEVLRKHLSEIEPGVKKFDYENQIYGAVIHETDKLGILIILVAQLKDLRTVGKAWKRIRPVVMTQLPLEHIVSEASVETKINRLIEKIEENLEDIQKYILTTTQKQRLIR